MTALEACPTAPGSVPSYLLDLFGRIAGRSATALRIGAPSVDRLQVETPVAPNLEGRQLLLLKPPVNGGWMYPQVLRDVFQRQDAGPFRLAFDEFHGVPPVNNIPINDS